MVTSSESHMHCRGQRFDPGQGEFPALSKPTTQAHSSRSVCQQLRPEHSQSAHERIRERKKRKALDLEYEAE